MKGMKIREDSSELEGGRGWKSVSVYGKAAWQTDKEIKG